MTGDMGTVDVDVVIVGGGVVGCSIAMHLSMLDVSVALIEMHNDVGEGASRANSGIANCGWSGRPGSLEARMVKESTSTWEDLTDRLGVLFRRVGICVLALDAEEEKALPALLERARENGVEARLVEGEELRAIAPHANPATRSAIHIPDEGVIDSVRLPVAYAELAELNGVTFYLGERVVGSTTTEGRIHEVVTDRRTFRASFVVNAAGTYGGIVSDALGSPGPEVTPRKGQWVLLDREFGEQVPTILTGVPGKMGHGAMVIPTAHGSVLLGPDAEDLDDRNRRDTTGDGIAEVLAQTARFMPSADLSHVIKSFAGLRPHADPTYQVGWSEKCSNLYQVVGIRSTGVSASPALGRRVRDDLVEAGLSGRRRPGAQERLPYQRPLWWDLDVERAARDELGRTVICACEKVTARDIHQALQPPLPATSIAGVAKRTHATWGRCQGSACLSGVAFITSLYQQGEAWEVRYGDHEGSGIGVGEADEC